MLDKKQILLVSLVTGGLVFCSAKHAYAQEASQALAQLQLLQKNIKSQNKQIENNLGKITETAKSKGSVLEAQLRQQVKDNAAKKGKQAENKNANDQDDMEGQLSEKEIINTQAFKKVTGRMFPLTTKQIVDVRKKFNEKEMALITTPSAPPRPTATSQMVNLSPGATPPVIRLAQGFVSSVVFLDSSGAPWPIVAYDLGDPDSFNIQWDKSGNTLLIQAKKLYNYGNLAIRLEGLNTPVMLTLVPGQKAVDYRVDMRVQGYGPNAKSLPVNVGLPSAASNSLLKVLEGVPPSNSQRLIVKGGPAQAWSLGDKMYVRTRLTILSPGWVGMMTSGDGTHAYEMLKAPVLLVSWHGKVMQLKLEGL